MLPAGWEKRLVRIDNENTNGVVGLCLNLHDLAISKYVACRPKDLEFTKELARRRMTERKILKRRLEKTDLSPALRSKVLSTIDADFQQARRRKQ
jgi:hypothetical protein